MANAIDQRRQSSAGRSPVVVPGSLQAARNSASGAYICDLAGSFWWPFQATVDPPFRSVPSQYDVSIGGGTAHDRQTKHALELDVQTVLPVERHGTMPQPQLFRPDPDHEDLECELRLLPAKVEAVTVTRGFIVALVRKWGLDPLIDDCELVASEITTNAVKAVLHSLDIQSIAVRLRLTQQQLILEVWDSSPDVPTLATVDPYSESGRGLHLVEALSNAWAAYPSPAGGKVVAAHWHLPFPRPRRP